MKVKLGALEDDGFQHSIYKLLPKCLSIQTEEGTKTKGVAKNYKDVRVRSYLLNSLQLLSGCQQSASEALPS
jgi:hypothetical protein